jgi:multiple sugar transport system permease protein
MNHRAALKQTQLGVIGVVVLVWTLVPIYHMLVMALTPGREAHAGQLWPANPTLQNFGTVFEQGHFFLNHFWVQLWNSVFVAVAAALITLAVASTAVFAISRLRLYWGSGITTLAILTYLIPAAFLAVPMYKTMSGYGLLNTRWALILSIVTFATPYAIWVLKQYADKLPQELEEAARIDGASPLQIFRFVFIPLMAPSLVAIGTYALLLAWNEYLYAFLMLSDARSLTLPVAIGLFLTTDDPPWNILMATGIIYSLPPAAIYYAFRRYMVSGLTAGAVKA